MVNGTGIKIMVKTSSQFDYQRYDVFPLSKKNTNSDQSRRRGFI